MAIPLLATLAMSLVSAKMQKDEERKARAHAREMNLSQTLADINARRAARAGDSGYMQQAVGGSVSQGPQRSSVGPMLAGIGQAILSQDAEPTPTPSSNDKPIFSSPAFNVQQGGSGWTGGNLNDDDDKWSRYA